MTRATVFRATTDTTFFTPLQIQPRAMLSLASNAWARWLQDRGTSQRGLLHAHRFGIVVVGIHLRYEEPMTFFDGDALDVQMLARVRKERSLMEGRVSYTSGARQVGSAVILVRPIALGDVESLAALPTLVTDHVLSLFDADEIDPSAPQRVVPNLLRQLEADGRTIGSGETSLTFHRHLCEVADQWAFTDIPTLVGAARENLVMSGSSAEGALRDGLRKPMREFIAELRQPFYVFDKARIETRAYALGDDVYFVHRLIGVSDGAEHAMAVERF